jgi:hypothetical protein
MATYLILRKNYVINVVEWDEQQAPDWQYPHPHDAVMPATNEHVGIGDWYEDAEGIFYRPLSTPPDLPEELATP